MRCRRCGVENHDDQAICEECGGLLAPPEKLGPPPAPAFFYDQGNSSAVALLGFLFVMLILCVPVIYFGSRVVGAEPATRAEAAAPVLPADGTPLVLLTMATSTPLPTVPAPAVPTLRVASPPAPAADDLAQDNEVLASDEDAEEEPTDEPPDPAPLPSPDTSTATPPPQTPTQRAQTLHLPTPTATRSVPAYRIDGVRYSHREGTSRITLDLSAVLLTSHPPVYAVDAVSHRLTVHLEIGASRYLNLPHDGLVKRIEVAPTGPGSADLIVDLAQPVVGVMDSFTQSPAALAFDLSTLPAP